MQLVKKLHRGFLITLLSITVVGCSSDLKESDYKTIKMGTEFGNFIANDENLIYFLYKDVVYDRLNATYKGSKLLNNRFDVTYTNAIGENISDSAYKFDQLNTNILKKCSYITFEKEDLLDSRTTLDKLFSDDISSIDFKINNPKKIEEINACVDSSIQTDPLDDDMISRFSSDSRFTQFKSNALSKQLEEVKADGKLTLAELASTYQLLDETIKSSIQNNFVKSNM